MKSNEEFIAGIYEKAAVYTEEKETNVIRLSRIAKVTRIAAMLAVCIGLAGAGSLMLGNGNEPVPSKVPMPSAENYGIALSSETGDEEGVMKLRIGPEMETVTVTGVVERIDTEEKRIMVKLLSDESIVSIRWDMLEPISEAIVAGTEISATGVMAENNGLEELVLTTLDNLEIK